MKTLTLIRHAKSSWKNPDLSDFERPLNKRGKRDLPLMAKRASDYNLRPDLIISSGAKRAITTAQALAEQFSLSPSQLQIIPELYEACSETLLYTLQNTDNHVKHLMLVGHNPGLELLAYHLTRTFSTPFPTAALLNMHLSIAQWQELAAGCATEILFDYPKQHSTQP